MAIPVIAIIDIGKTNKKLFLFDESYHVVLEKTECIREIMDEDGDPCEDIVKLIEFVQGTLSSLLNSEQFDIKAVNFSAYGASFVYLNENGEVIPPLYNYLKAYPPAIKLRFYDIYGQEEEIALQTASPVLGSLNSGMQIYRLKYEKPEKFSKIKCALHLPQFVSYLISGNAVCEFTSLGCHTNLIDFKTRKYHAWVTKEKLTDIFPAIVPSDYVLSTSFAGKTFLCGTGLHDSSAALIPYLIIFKSPFVLISTGTWCISLNPFNHSPLTAEELKQDCLCYTTFEGDPVKASRLFSGHEYEIEVKRIATYFKSDEKEFQSLKIDFDIVKGLEKKQIVEFGGMELDTFASHIEAYHFLVYTLARKQVQSTDLILNNGQVDVIFVDGGFGKNDIFMNFLAMMYPDKKVYAASIPQGTALGAALAIHSHWNTNPIAPDLIKLIHYRPQVFS